MWPAPKWPLTAEAIAREAEGYNGVANKRMINKLFRMQDDFYLWPISGEFSATEKAIRRSQKFQRESGIYLVGLEYALFLESEISRIVNNEV